MGPNGTDLEAVDHDERASVRLIFTSPRLIEQRLTSRYDAFDQ